MTLPRRLFQSPASFSFHEDRSDAPSTPTTSSPTPRYVPAVTSTSGRPFIVEKPVRYGLPKEEVAQATSRGWSLHAPQDTDDEDEDEDAARQPGVAPPTLMELSLGNRQQQRALLLEIQQQRTCGQVLQQWREIDQQELAACADVAASIKAKQDELQQRDAALLRQHLSDRQQRRAEVERLHERTAAEQSQHVQRVQERQLAEARRLEAEQRRKEEEARRQREQQEAEAKRLADEERRRAEQAAAAAAAALQAQQQAAAAAATAPPSTTLAARPAAAAAKANGGAASSEARPGLRIAASAAADEAAYAQKLAEAEAAAATFSGNEQMKPHKRTIDKALTKFVQQISATIEQVAAKSQELIRLLNELHDPAPRAYALITLASKLVAQCEAQVMKLPRFAFPLAMVTANVACHHPALMDVLIPKLHTACILTVPKYYVFQKGRDTDADYFGRLGYREFVDNKGVQRLETTDEYLARMQGYILFYAAICQTSVPPGQPQPHGLGQGWAYLARLLNALPANRNTATALEAFLKVAGYRLHEVYRGQFVKLLGVVAGEFFAELQASGDAEARAVATRLTAYLQDGKFLKLPEGHGRTLPQVDASQYQRAGD